VAGQAAAEEEALRLEERVVLVILRHYQGQKMN
jgi:hypothetical protein